MKIYFRHKKDHSYIVHVCGYRLFGVQVTTKKGKSRWLSNYEFTRDFEVIDNV